MANYVVDASIVVEALVTGPYTTNAKALFQQIKLRDILLAPEFCLLECTNVLWKHMRFHGMTLAQTQPLISDLQFLLIKRVLMKRLLGGTLQIAAHHNLAVCDAAYILLAEKMGYPLITIDTKQSAVATTVGVNVIPVTTFVL